MGVLLAGNTMVGAAGGLDYQPINDCFGAVTEAADTPICVVIPPASGLRACAGTWNYDNGATAHVLTWMTCLGISEVATEVEGSAATLRVRDTTMPGANRKVAANDYVIAQNGVTGEWEAHLVSAVAADNRTLTIGAIGANDSSPADRPVYFMGAPGASGDHSRRIWNIAGNEDYKFEWAGDFRLRSCSGSQKGTPIMAHVNNITAAGTFRHVQYFYDGY
jgi:hypothetical protein